MLQQKPLLFQLLTAYWWTSKFARDTLTGPAWKPKLKNGLFPHFCMFNGKCRDAEFNRQVTCIWTIFEVG